MDGFTFLRFVMSRQPTPVLVLSGHSDDREVFKALELGAVDFIAKPTEGSFLDLERIQQELIRKIHGVRELRIERVSSGLSRPPELTVPAKPGAARAGRVPRVVAIGSSTGGPAALMRVFGSFLEPPPYAIVVAQHMPAGFTRGFAERLDRLTVLTAREASPGESPAPGVLLVAPGNQHLELDRAGPGAVVRLVPRRDDDKYAPSVDRLFVTAARVYGEDLLAVVLTGMGDDGRLGAAAVKEHNGRVIAESEETAVIFGMPRQAIRAGCVDAVLPLHDIAGALRRGQVPDAAVMPRAGTSATASASWTR
jgi:two-component system chemotaxis response regulator CheB